MRASGASCSPELWVDDLAAAVEFYELALQAVVEHRVGEPDDSRGWPSSRSPTSTGSGWAAFVDQFGYEWEAIRFGAWPSGSR